MENITIVKTEGTVLELHDPKKLKTRGVDFENIVSFKKPAPVAVEKPVQEIEEVKATIEEPVIQPEEVSEYKEPVSFAYEAHVEEEIAPDTIKEITGKLEESYKGVKPVVTKKIEEPVAVVKEESTLTKEEFEKVLNVESYTPKIGAYKEGVKADYDKLNGKIADKQLEIDGITSKYGKEVEESTNLQENKKKVQTVLTGINNIDLDFLQTEKDELSKNVVEALSMLFTNRREAYNELNQEIKNSDDRKRALGKDESKAREELKELKEAQVAFMNKHYPLILNVNEKDAKNRELDDQITEITGIKDEPKEEKKSVLSIENIVERQNFNTANPFSGLREEEEVSYRRVA